MTQISIDAIRIDGGTQSRTELNNGVVTEYCQVIRAGADFPPITVFFDGTDYWLADGFHRYHAYRAVGAVEIDAIVKNGTKRDALLFSLGANADHGLRRTNADKRKAVTTMLEDPEWMAWSNREIARACCVGDQLVAEVRKSICVKTQIDGGESPSPVRKVSRGGTTYEQNTANIGGCKKQEKSTGEASQQDPEEPEENPDFSNHPEPPKETHEDRITELAYLLEVKEREIQTLSTIINADDSLSAAHEEITRLQGLVKTLESRIQGLMAEKAEAIKTVKQRDRQIKALEAKLPK